MSRDPRDDIYIGYHNPRMAYSQPVMVYASTCAPMGMYCATTNSIESFRPLVVEDAYNVADHKRVSWAGRCLYCGVKYQHHERHCVACGAPT